MSLPDDLFRRLRRLRDPRRLGWPGALGAGLLVCAAAFQWAVVTPERQRFEELRAGGDAGTQELAAVRRRDDGAADQLARFRRAFPPAAELPDRLDRLFALAQAHDLGLERGEYKLTRQAAGRLERIQITLPVRSTYPQVRKFIAASQAEIPGLILDHVQFERQRAADTGVNATIKLALYLEPMP